MLDTCFAQFKPIVEILPIQLNAAVTPHAWNGFSGDHVAKRGWTAPDVLGRRGYIQQSAFLSIQRGRESLVNTFGDGVGQSIEPLISSACHRDFPKFL
jgi:hypothetical protein